jgi:G:T/U-mismatch repair DNA glycosylase
MSKIIKHQSIELNWIHPNELLNPKTLVLGSFNPFENIENKTDYYYGREQNYFWKTIAVAIKEEENYFFDKAKGYQRKIEIMEKRFCCFDVIDSIDFYCQDEKLLLEYLNNEIFSKFLDQKIWTSKTKYKQAPITLTRKYNDSIIDFLKQSESITKVIHTMGNNRLSESSTNPKERKKEFGFEKFMAKIKAVCDKKNIAIEYFSLSPSGYAIKTGKTHKDALQNWLIENLELPTN